ncbi:MAG: hypothetical protein ACLT98_06710 [Eggerthellaceae bacterium]
MRRLPRRRHTPKLDDDGDNRHDADELEFGDILLEGGHNRTVQRAAAGKAASMYARGSRTVFQFG